MEITGLLTDETILSEIGARIARRRIDLGLTQANLAEPAGVAKRTVERLESGASAQMSSMVRILRVLELLPGVDAMLPEGEGAPRPLDLLKRKGKVRERASPRLRPDSSDEPWVWGDEK